jgi:hypothetical protein
MTATDSEAVRPPAVSGWLSWYFTRGVLTVVTLPLFLLLAYSVASASLGALLQWLGAVRVTWAVVGAVPALLVAFVVWIPAILPPALYYSLLKNLPGLWLRPEASTSGKLALSAGVLIALPALAWLVSAALGSGIGWMADRDPCAAFAAGVTGSVRPVGCS